MPASLAALFAELDACPDGLSLGTLRNLLEEVAIDLADLHHAVQFGRDGYRRNLLHQGPNYHALLLCWRAGQRSPIHDHRGSDCVFRVLHGVATETLFTRAANGMIYPTCSRELHTGSIGASRDTDIHQVSNLQADNADLITLHIYSPPLLVMGQYSLTDGRRSEFVDRVFAFGDGAGI